MEARKRGGNSHANESFWRRLASPDSRSCVFEIVENVQSGLIKVTTCIGQHDGTRGAVNEFRAKLIFKGRDLFADCRLSNPAFLGNRREAAFFNHADEYLHCIEFVHTILRIPRWNGFCGEE